MTPEERIDSLTNTVFHVLASKTHKKDEFSNVFIKNSIADNIMKLGPRNNLSGKISIRAKEKLDSGEIKYSKICREHFITRTKTAVDIISLFDMKFSNNQISNSEIISEIRSLLQEGSKVHLVLTEENNLLATYQKNRNITPEQAYEMAGVYLISYEHRPENTQYIYNDKIYHTQDEISSELNISKYRVKKMINNTEIRVERSRLGNI